jgi:hypothetical protein
VTLDEVKIDDEQLRENPMVSLVEVNTDDEHLQEK